MFLTLQWFSMISVWPSKVQGFQDTTISSFTVLKMCLLSSCSWKVKRSRSGLKKGKHATSRTRRRDSQIRSVNNDFYHANAILCSWIIEPQWTTYCIKNLCFILHVAHWIERKNIYCRFNWLVWVYQSTLCLYVSQVKQQREKYIYVLL